MSQALVPTMSRCLRGAVGHVCAHRDWVRQANFAGRGIVAGTKREPQPTTYEGKAPGT
jgi:hypothetical protein